jgi:hypothetical protein
LQDSPVDAISSPDFSSDVGDVVENKRPGVILANIETPVDSRAGLGDGVEIILAGDSGLADARADLRRDFCGVEQWYPKRLGNGRKLPDAKSPMATSPFQIAARAMVGTMIGGGSQELPSSSLGIIALNKVLQILDLAHARMFAPECSLAVTCPVASKRPASAYAKR